MPRRRGCYYVRSLIVQALHVDIPAVYLYSLPALPQPTLVSLFGLFSPNLAINAPLRKNIYHRSILQL